jgi:hypothetical protein
MVVTDLPASPNRLAFDGQSTRLAAACRECDYAVVLELPTGREVARVSGIALADLNAFEFFGEGLLAIRQDKVVRCDLREGTFTTVWAEQGVYPQSATLVPDGRLLAIGVQGGLILYDLQNKQTRRLNSRADAAPYHPVFSPGGLYVAADLFDYGGPDFIVVWDTRSGRRCRTFEVGFDYLGAMAFRGDTLALAVGQSDIDLYEPDQGEEPAKTYSVSGEPEAMQFRDGGATLAVVGYGEGLTLLETSTGRVLRRAGPPGNRKVGCCQPNADWSLLAGGIEGGILLWPSGLA